MVQNGGSVFHQWSWRKVLEGDGGRPLYLACRNAKGRMLAACPFFYHEGRHLSYLESLPETITGGLVISRELTDTSQVITSLRKSVDFSPFNPVVEMRIKAHQQHIIETMLALGYHYALTHEHYILDLDMKKPDDVWNSGFKKHDRQAVKYYEQRTAFRLARSEHDLLALEKPDWSLYHGRIFHADFISRMLATLGDQIQVAVAVESGMPIAGFLMLFDHPKVQNRTVYLLGVRHSVTRNIHSPVTFINWKAINWAHENGFRYVNFGTYGLGQSFDVSDIFYKLKERFEITLEPSYEFILPTSGVAYSIAKSISRVI